MGWGWEPRKFPGESERGERPGPAVPGLGGLGVGELGALVSHPRGFLGALRECGTLLSPLRDIQGLMQDLGLPVSHLRRFLGCLWSRSPPASPTWACWGQGQLGALPGTSGRFGVASGPHDRSWGLTGGGRVPSRGFGGSMAPQPLGKVRARLGSGGLGALPALPNPQPSPQTLPKPQSSKNPKTSQFYSTGTN